VRGYPARSFHAFDCDSVSILQNGPFPAPHFSFGAPPAMLIKEAFRGGPMITAPLSKEEIERNMRDVAHAIAQQELEGLHVSAATIEDMKRAAQGEIRSDDVIRNIHARVKNAQVLRQMTTTLTRNPGF
jgi:hypothetical protein